MTQETTLRSRASAGKHSRATTNFDRKLGERMRERRLELGMSQEQLAEILGVTFQQVQKYERGVNRVAASRLQAIAAALQIPVSGFFESAPAPSRSTADRVLASAEGRELVALMASIGSVKVRRKLVELARTLTEGA